MNPERNMTSTVRLAPIEPGTRSELAELEAKIIRKRGKITPLYQHLLNSPEMAQGWEELLSVVRQRNSIPADLRELIILRVAILNHAPYEFEAHISHARETGLSDAKIQAVKEMAIGSIFTPHEQLVLELTDTMTQQVHVPDALFEKIAQHYAGKELLDLCITIGAYNMVSRVLVALHIGH